MAKGGFDLTSSLTKKYGPLPGYAWAGILAIGAYFAIPLIRGKSATAGTTTAAPKPPPTAASYFYPNPPPAPTAPAAPLYVTVQLREPFAGADVPIVSDPKLGDSSIKGHLKPSTFVEISPTPYPGADNRGITIWYQLKQGGYVSGWDIVGLPAATPAAPGAVGGAAKSIGSRSTWAPYHLDLRRQPRFQHYVRSPVGGAASKAQHHAAVTKIAAQAGLHPARLLALNPNPTDYIHIA